MGAGSHELHKTMRSVTASYWIPIQVEEPPKDRGRYTGHTDVKYDPVEGLMSRVIENMTYIYGNIAGMHYVVESVDDGDEGSCFFHTEVVITGIVAGDADADDYIHEDWPTDLSDQFRTEWDKSLPDGLLGYDLNPAQDSPSMTTHNGSWK